MTRDTWTPYDEPETLWQKLTFPSLRFAFEQGSKTGYLEGKGDGIDSAYMSMKPLLDDPKWLRERARELEGTNE